MTLPITELLSRLSAVLKTEGVDSLGLAPPASESEIATFGDALSCELPQEFRELLALANGQQNPPPIPLLPGGQLISLTDLLENWQAEKAEFDEGYEEEEECGSEDRIRFLRYHPLRIPIGGTPWMDGDNAYLDLTPGPAGTVGQVIGLVTECDFIVLGDSLRDYFRRLLQLLESGKLKVADVEGVRCFLRADGEATRWDYLLMEEV
jgi:cell wall assembly regulator SMI1